MSGRREYRSLVCAGCGKGYSGNYAQDMLYRHCREKHSELKGRVTRWGLEGPAPVDAVPSSAVDLCNLQCNLSLPEDLLDIQFGSEASLPEDLWDLELGPESREFAPQVSLPLGAVPVPAEILDAAMYNASLLIYGSLGDMYTREMGRFSRILISGPIWVEFMRKMRKFLPGCPDRVFNAIFQGFYADLLQQES